MTISYHERFKEDVRKAFVLVRKGELPMGRRKTSLKRASSRYVLAQSVDYLAAKAAGKNPPIPLRDSDTLNTCGYMLIYEYMTNRHPDKVANDEYPILSDNQTLLRQRREMSLSDVNTGKDDVTIGRTLDHDGVKRRIYDYMTPNRDTSVVPARYLDLYDAIDNAGLTERQLEAINLVYFEGMTQEVAADVMGVGQDVVSRHIKAGIRILRAYMTKV